jgi:uncharacterized protein YeaO (DUF488 family)
LRPAGGKAGLVCVTVVLKRVYEKPSVADGVRVLVDRLWPRGVKKETIDHWLRDLAPSNELRHWFHARPAQWPLFRKRYLKELTQPAASQSLEQLYELANQRKKLTLLFASRNLEHNNAVVLKDLIDGMRKPPNSTGPAKAASGAAGARASRPR